MWCLRNRKWVNVVCTLYHRKADKRKHGPRVEHLCFAAHQALFLSLILCNPGNGLLPQMEKLRCQWLAPGPTAAHPSPTLRACCSQDVSPKDISQAVDPLWLGKVHPAELMAPSTGARWFPSKITGTGTVPAGWFLGRLLLSRPQEAQPLLESLGTWVLWAWEALGDTHTPAPTPYNTNCLIFSVLGIRVLRFPPDRCCTTNSVARFK